MDVRDEGFEVGPRIRGIHRVIQVIRISLISELTGIVILSLKCIVGEAGRL